MAATTKSELAAQLRALQKSLDRGKAKSARLKKELSEALERQTATAEILKVISSSPTDVQPVFDTIARNAVTLCGSEYSNVHPFDGELLHYAASHGLPPGRKEAIARKYPMRPDLSQVSGRAILTKSVVRMEDTLSDPDYDHGVAISGARRLVGALMMREGKPLGVIVVGWSEPGPIPKHQEELLKIFADQAVIAIENVRMFNETREALEGQTATAEILKVIASSPSDVQPVFDAIVKSALRLIGGISAVVTRVVDDALHLAALTSTSESGDEAARRMFPAPLSRGMQGKVVHTGKPAFISDTETDAEMPSAFREMARARGFRSMLIVPLMREGVAIGTLNVSRRAPGRFSSHQIDLLRSFADQAVIAIENVRLFNETREALEQQTATSNVLREISRSKFDLNSVLQSLLDSAMRLSNASSSAMFLPDGDNAYRVALLSGYGPDSALEKTLRGNPIRPGRDTTTGRALLERRTVHAHDIRSQTGYRQDLVAVAAYRTNLAVPMLRDGEPVGVITLTRGTDVNPFTDKQIRLVETFAAQAVIAIENVRLFNETKEALERQTATGEILASISGSMTDTKPVFDAIVRNLLRLFGTRFAVLQLLRDGIVEMPAVDGEPGFERLLERYPRALDETTVGGQVMVSKQTVQYSPVIDNPAAPAGTQQFARDFGFNSVVFAPMIREEKVIGAIGTARREPKMFDEKQVALLQSFAAQAVIAIENVRLFNETKEALERQTATSEILRVISSSPTDTQPVFDAIAQSGLKLFPSAAVAVALPEGNQVRAAAIATRDPALAEAWKARFPDPLSRDRMHGTAILDRRLVDVPDAEAEVNGPWGPGIRNFLASGNRAITIVPMIRGDSAIGAISVIRLAPGSLTENQVALLRTFADQAVIAIENARLFNETREALEQQTATAEILRVISSSPTDIQPVFDAVAESAARLCGANDVLIRRLDGDQLRLVAHFGSVPVAADAHALSRGTVGGRAATECRTIHVHDIVEAHVRGEFPETGFLQRDGGYRTLLGVPMVREKAAIGVILVRRMEMRPFSDKQIRLLETFADQAAIAIENVRLFNETEEALERQTATAEILKVIASSPTDVQPVFDVIVESAVRLCGARFGRVYRYDGSVIQMVAGHGLSTNGLAQVQRVFPRPAADDTIVGRVILTRRPFYVRDVEREEKVPALSRQMIEALGTRSQVTIPMLRAGEPIGAITMGWCEPEAFDDQQVTLLQTFADQAVIAIENVRLFNETKEALERQTATAEILRVIASSPSDVQPVFDAIARSANRLIGGFSTAVARIVGDALHLVAYTSTGESGDEALKNIFPMPVSRSGVVTKAVRTGAPVCVSDTETDPDASSALREVARARGYRSMLITPLLREDVATGIISVTRREPGEFSSHQIDLLKTFADQAVIAIENVRLFNETREALERQTATAEILKVISSSPTDTQPVFDAIVRNATSLCEGMYANVFRYDGEMLHYVASHGWPPQLLQVLRDSYPVRPNRLRVAGRVILEKRAVRLEDTRSDPDYDPDLARALEYRRILGIPMLRDGNVIGVISVGWAEPGPIQQRHEDLLKTFADQAVIAIENVRLFSETREALERQTATAEVLRVISGSPTDTQPVFDAILERATKLCDADTGILFRYEDGAYQALATRIPDPAFAALFKEPRRPSPGGKTGLGRLMREKRAIHIPDALDDDAYRAGDPMRLETLKGGMRCWLGVPMLKDGEMVGAIVIYRSEPRAFSDQQISLLQTFADQAVIAIENVRLFNETKESLEQQTAISEILRVISTSPSDVQPVLDAVAERAARICAAQFADIVLAEGETLRFAAGIGAIGRPGAADAVPLDRSSVMGRSIVDRATVHVADLQNAPESEFPLGQMLAHKYGHRTILAVPLVREDRALGTIVLRRTEVRPFDDKHIALLKTFADQAAIAIENVRLFNETKEALERQTATAEILKVISSSPTDLQPVFDAILGNATQLCDAHFGILNLHEAGKFRTVAQRGANPEYEKWLFERGPFDPEYALVRMMAERQPVHIADVSDTQAYRDGKPSTVKLVDVAKARTFLVVPLLMKGGVIGNVAVYRPEVRPFSDKQLSLLNTFADQAVIAIENVRLFNETKEALERQTATAEILKVISSSPTDVQPVLDAVAESAARLCGAIDALIMRVDGAMMHRVAHFGAMAAVSDVRPVTRDTPSGRAILERRTIHIDDILEEFARGDYLEARALQKGTGFRTVLVAPLMREDAVIGVITIRRVEVRPFTAKQMELVKTFAGQAVIAIENVRLFNETKEALEQQTATAEILRVISGSPTDTQPVFDAIVKSALRLFDGQGVGIVLAEGDLMQIGSAGGIIDLESVRKRYPLPLNRDSVSGQAILDRSSVNIADSQAPEMPELVRSLGRALDYRAVASAPMMREGVATGAITVVRKAPGALAEKEIALLKTFADQAVIAIENVRLFKELQARTEALTRSVGQLTALGEVGQAISSTLDLETVLKTIVSRAVQLTGLDAGGIYEYDERAEEFHLRAAENMDDEIVEILRSNPIRKSEGAVGSTAVTREPIQVPETQDESYPSRLREILVRTGRRALLAVPLLREDHIIGALAVQRNTPGLFAPEIVELLKTFATQSAMAIQNARLFREIAEKGKQLEVASRHKSDFLASMSHELRTPLNAILGFNEMILGEVYGDVPQDMQAPLAQIQTSGKLLLRLINNVLDLAKIEAGRMELSLQDYSVHDTVESVRSTLRPLAAEKELEFLATVPADIPLAFGDSGRITQCLMNLAGNSLKFTKAGKVEISVEARGDLLVYKVADTGIGIPPDKLETVFAEFKQTDASIASEYGGTGLGLSISRKFVEMHGGRIWVESEPGKGSTFIFEIPLRVNTGAPA